MMSVSCLCIVDNTDCRQDYEKVMAAGGDEGDMRPVRVTAEMSREEVVQEIINTLKNNLPRQTS